MKLVKERCPNCGREFAINLCTCSFYCPYCLEKGRFDEITGTHWTEDRKIEGEEIRKIRTNLNKLRRLK